MISLKVLYKVFSFMLWISLFFILTMVLYPVSFISKDFVKPYLIKIVSFCSKGILELLNIQIQTNRKIDKKTYLIVSNHLSYLDVLIISALHPAAFVTSLEIKKSLFLGQIITLAGCLIVNRKDKSRIKEEIECIRNTLRNNISVVVFPEATSTNAECVLPFKKPLFESSIATQTPILPLTLNYKKINGAAFNHLNRDLICWYGEMTFLPHFLRILDQNYIEVEIIVHDSFSPTLLTTLEASTHAHTIIKNSFESVSKCEAL